MNDNDLMYVASCVQDYLRMIPPSCQVAVGEKVTFALRQIGKKLEESQVQQAFSFDDLDKGTADG